MSRSDLKRFDPEPCLIQILLPLYDKDGQPIARERHREVRREPTGYFGGHTAFARREGLRQEDANAAVSDVVIFEATARRAGRGAPAPVPP